MTITISLFIANTDFNVIPSCLSKIPCTQQFSSAPTKSVTRRLCIRTAVRIILIFQIRIKSGFLQWISFELVSGFLKWNPDYSNLNFKKKKKKFFVIRFSMHRARHSNRLTPPGHTPALSYPCPLLGGLRVHDSRVIPPQAWLIVMNLHVCFVCHVVVLWVV